MKRYIYLLSAILVLMTSIAAYSQTAKPLNPSDVNKPTAPAFSLTSMKGEKFESAALRGKVVVLNFWFIGCKPCVEEFGKLNNLVESFKNKKVVFLAPTLDKTSALKTFLRKHPFKYQVVPNAGGLILNSYSDETENVVFPTHIVIDKEGKIETRLEGAKAMEDLRKAITRLVNSTSERRK